MFLISYIVDPDGVVVSSPMEEAHTKEARTIVISHAFKAGKEIITNAVIHQNKTFVLNFELKDFFLLFT